MTRKEAYTELLSNNKKIKHKDFLKNEYLWSGKNQNSILTEDNFEFSDMFWSTERFVDGWEIVF